MTGKVQVRLVGALVATGDTDAGAAVRPRSHELARFQRRMMRTYLGTPTPVICPSDDIARLRHRCLGRRR